MDMEMLPAFRSRGQAYALLVLIALVLTLPLGLRRIGWPSRAEVARAVSGNMGPVGHYVHVVYEDPEDADVLLVGASPMHRALLAGSLEGLLSAVLGRPAKVRELIMWWYNPDLEYVMLRDYLDHHKAGLVALELPTKLICPTTPHRAMFRWLRHGEFPEVVAELPKRTRASLYAEEVFGAPRQLLSLVRPNLVAAEEKEDATFESTETATRLVGFDGAPFRKSSVIPNTNDGSPWLLPVTSPKIEDTGLPEGHSPYVETYLRKMAELVRERGSQFVLMHFPESEEGMAAKDKVQAVVSLKRLFGADAKLIGIPTRDLFPGLSADRIKDFYADERHFNLNGAEAYCAAVAPAVAEAYREANPAPGRP